MTAYEYHLTNTDPTAFIIDLLGQIQATDVLDLACGQGGFTGMLANGLEGFTQLTGIDMDEKMIALAKNNFNQGNVDFKLMDAANLNYPDNSFDLVSCAFSLHHLPEPTRTIGEIRRVLKPGGVAIFVEMYQDHLTETQKSESNLHHWAGRIDTALGLSHRQTYLREEILSLIDPDNWGSAEIFDLADLESDPKGEEITNLILSTIDRVLQRAEGLPNYADHEQQAEEMRQRAQTTGTHISTRLVALLQN